MTWTRMTRTRIFLEVCGERAPCYTISVDGPDSCRGVFAGVGSNDGEVWEITVELTLDYLDPVGQKVVELLSDGHHARLLVTDDPHRFASVPSGAREVARRIAGEASVVVGPMYSVDFQRHVLEVTSHDGSGHRVFAPVTAAAVAVLFCTRINAVDGMRLSRMIGLITESEMLARG